MTTHTQTMTSSGYTVTGQQQSLMMVLYNNTLLFYTFELVLVPAQSVDVVRVVEPEVHLDERFASLQRQHVPGLGLGEQLADAALRQAEDRLAEQLLAEVVELQDLLHLRRDQQRVQLVRHGRHLEEVGLQGRCCCCC